MVVAHVPSSMAGARAVHRRRVCCCAPSSASKRTTSSGESGDESSSTDAPAFPRLPPQKKTRGGIVSAVNRENIRGLCGSSRFAQRVRSDRRRAAADPQEKHVLVIGEPGTPKLDVAKMVCLESPRRKGDVRIVRCGKMKSRRRDAATQLADALDVICPGGIALLSDVHELPDSALHVLRDRLDDSPPRHPPGEGVRLVLTTSRAMDTNLNLSSLSTAVTTIKVPPLRVRAKDLAAETRFFLRQAAVASDVSNAQTLKGVTPAALRLLEAYTWPGNDAELQNVLQRALVHEIGIAERDGVSLPTMLSEDVLWPGSEGPQSRDKRLRTDLLRLWPLLRQAMRSELWMDGFMQYVVRPAFAVVVIGLFVAPQARADNAFLNVFWAWWWPGILLLYPFVGRLWCSFCPFMAYGELAQRFRLKMLPQVPLMNWPRDALDKGGGWFLFALFAVILEWEELWALEDHAALSSWLLLLITAGAVIGSLLYKKRVWCRYLCPIGGMNGLYAKLALTELRAEQGVCSAECSTYGCYKGGPAVEPEGMESEGCPLGVHPAQLQDNRNCVLCAECVKACPHKSVKVNFRFTADDILQPMHNATAYEVSLLFLLFGAVFCHHIPEASTLLQMPEAITTAVTKSAQSVGNIFTSRPFAWHTGLATASLAYPGVLALAAHRAAGSRGNFVREAYSYLPLCWLASIAHYLDLGMGEAGSILPAAARMVGLVDLAPRLPVLVASPEVIDFSQGLCVVVGCLSSLVLLRVLARRPWLEIGWQCGGMIVLSAQLWWLLLVA